MGDGAFGSIQSSQEDARRFANPVSNYRALLQLELKRSPDQVLRHLEQLLGQGHQFIGRQPAMTLVHCLGERIRDPGANPDHGGLLDPELHGDRVRGLKADAANVPSQAVWVIGHDLNGIGAVGLEDAHGPGGADPMAVQEDHDFAHGLLFGPGGEKAGRTKGADAIDLTQPIRTGLDDVENLFAECADEFLGVDWSYATDHAGRQVSLDAVHRGRRRGAQEPRFELLAVGAVVDPLTRGRDPFADRDDSGMAHHRHDVTVSARPRAQDTETILSVMVGYSLDETCQHFLGVRPRTHADHRISALETSPGDFLFWKLAAIARS